MALDKKDVITGACERLLRKVPKEFICPVCGERHVYESKRSISKASRAMPIRLRCTGVPGIEGFDLYHKDEDMFAEMVVDGCEQTIGLANIPVPLPKKDFETRGDTMVTKVIYPVGDHYCSNLKCRYRQTCPSAIARDTKSNMAFFYLQFVYEDKDIKAAMEEAENEAREREEREMAARKVVEVKETKVEECGRWYYRKVFFIFWFRKILGCRKT